MERRLKGVYYTTESDNCPIEEWLDKQSKPIHAKLQRSMNLLESKTVGQSLDFVSPLGKGLFQIAIETEKKWPRIIFFYYEQNQIVYLHGFIKKTNKTPRREIEIAEQRKKDFYKQKEKEK